MSNPEIDVPSNPDEHPGESAVAREPLTSFQSVIDVPPLKPHVIQTRFVVQQPPASLILYFCPACGKAVEGSYDLEPARPRCTKRIHLATPVAAEYVLKPDDPAF